MLWVSLFPETACQTGSLYMQFVKIHNEIGVLTTAVRESRFGGGNQVAQGVLGAVKYRITHQTGYVLTS
jgi:hypothetical protein